MIYRFKTDQLLPGDILAGRSQARLGRAIRGILGSFTNHNALILKHNTRGWCIGDTVSPKSSIVPLSHYEDLVNNGLYEIRVWRVVDASDDERMMASMYWQQHCDGIPYDWINLGRMWVFRFTNSLPYQIRKRSQKTFCTKNTFEAWRKGPCIDPLLKDDGRKKKNPTPRTPENRLAQGTLINVSSLVFGLVPERVTVCPGLLTS